MAIVQSTIRVYSDPNKTTLIATEVTQSAATAIVVDGLPVGSELYATAQVTDDSNLTSDESSVYEFYTLPNVVYFTQPQVSQGSISVQLEGQTNDIAIDYYGMRYSTDEDFTTYTDVQSQQGGIDIYGLSEHTTYYIKPFVIDEFGRKYVNGDAEMDVTTPYAAPTVTWVGTSSVGQTTWAQQVNIQSSSTVTAASVIYGPSGGTQTTTALTAQTGTQNVSLTGLTPGTTYTIKVSATNASGTSYSTTQTITTSSAGASAAVALNSLSNTTNQCTVTSTATLDASATIVAHELGAYQRLDHSDSPIESHTQTIATSSYSETFSHLSTDEEYYIFSKVTYTVGNDPTQLTVWSAPLTIDTYTLVSFGNITTTNNSASIPYSSDGVSTSINIEYSVNQSSWTTLPVSNLVGGTLSVNGLTPNTTYYLRGRAQNSAAGWSGYTTTTFATTQVIPVVNITSITDITPVSATANISVS